MVGDNLARDVKGSIAAGLGAVWVNRLGRPAADRPPGVADVATLRDLPRVLAVTTGR